MAWKARINDFLFLVLKVNHCIVDDYCAVLMVLNDIYYLIEFVFESLLRDFYRIYLLFLRYFDHLTSLPAEVSGFHGAQRTDGMDAFLFPTDRGG